MGLTREEAAEEVNVCEWLNFDERLDLIQTLTFLENIGEDVPIALSLAREGQAVGLLQRARKGQSIATDIEIVEYKLPELESLEVFDFFRDIEPFRIHSIDRERAKLSESELRANSASILVSNSMCDTLAQNVSLFIQQLFSGSAEDGQHGVDDSALQIISKLSNTAQVRNESSTGTFSKLRYDAYFSTPPIVAVEEKNTRAQMSSAKADLQRKFAQIPHYAALPYTIGIAIGRDCWSFHRLRQGKFVSSTCPLYATTLRSQLKILKAIVNIASYVNYVTVNELVEPMAFDFFASHNDPRCTIYLDHKQVRKAYHQLTEAERTLLITFYKKAKGVPYLEQATTEVQQRKDGGVDLVVWSGPIGVCRLPRDLEELQLSMACFLEMCQVLHGRQWTHGDLRWPNTARLVDSKWVVFDSELARPIDGVSSVPYSAHHTDAGQVNTDYADLRMLGAMLNEIGFKNQAARDLQYELTHCEALCRHAGQLLHHRFFKGLDLSGVSPEPDAQLSEDESIEIHEQRRRGASLLESHSSSKTKDVSKKQESPQARAKRNRKCF